MNPVNNHMRQTAAYKSAVAAEFMYAGITEMVASQFICVPGAFIAEYYDTDLGMVLVKTGAVLSLCGVLTCAISIIKSLSLFRR